MQLFIFSRGKKCCCLFSHRADRKQKEAMFSTTRLSNLLEKWSVSDGGSVSKKNEDSMPPSPGELGAIRIKEQKEEHKTEHIHGVVKTLQHMSRVLLKSQFVSCQTQTDKLHCYQSETGVLHVLQTDTGVESAGEQLKKIHERYVSLIVMSPRYRGVKERGKIESTVFEKEVEKILGEII
ncbi:MAG: TRAPP complex subunit Bet5 [Amphiamblys sp. WSBS2006]|nr:MAG: TRAPP complex subunit Bet5 [Amphiamblys sp. WSBS2006]